MDFLKAEQISNYKWRVNAIPFGGPFKGKDFDGEYFSPRTDIKPHWFKERPVIFDHGQDESTGDEDYGIQDALTKLNDGWWGTLYLNRSARYWAQVDALLRAGKMYGSSGSMPHLVKKANDGEILVWPHVEQTLTPTPANPYARVTASKAVAHFTSAGITIDDALKSLLVDLDDLADDLRADLGQGDAAAMRRVESLETLFRALREIA